MDGVHEMAAEIFVRIIAARTTSGTASPQEAHDLAHQEVRVHPR